MHICINDIIIHTFMILYIYTLMILWIYTLTILYIYALMILCIYALYHHSWCSLRFLSTTSYMCFCFCYIFFLSPSFLSNSFHHHPISTFFETHKIFKPQYFKTKLWFYLLYCIFFYAIYQFISSSSPIWYGLFWILFFSRWITYFQELILKLLPFEPKVTKMKVSKIIQNIYNCSLNYYSFSFSETRPHKPRFPWKQKRNVEAKLLANVC